jgi:hypothetical protein
MEPLEYPGKPKRDSEAEAAAARTEAQSVGHAMRAISGQLIYDVRRFLTLRLCRAVMSPQLLAHAAPYDVKIVPDDMDEPVCVICWYASSQTAQAALESKKREMLRQINEKSVQLVDDFRYELAGSERIAQQLNILSAGPD